VQYPDWLIRVFGTRALMPASPPTPALESCATPLADQVIHFQTEDNDLLILPLT